MAPQAETGPERRYRAKRLVAEAALVALGAALEHLSERSAEIRRELEEWPEGLTFALGVRPRGPTIALRKERGGLRWLGRGEREAEVKFLFKNLDVALPVLTGQRPTHSCLVEKRAVVEGALDAGMVMLRVTTIAAKFLFPGFMLPKLCKRVPERTPDDRRLQARLYATLGPRLLRHLVE